MKKRIKYPPTRQSCGSISRKPPLRIQPLLERLEDRLAPATDFWTGAAGTGLWSSGGNWASGVHPASNDTIVFETNLTTTAGGSTLNTGVNAYNTVDDIANLSVAEILFDNGTQYTVHTAGSNNPFALGGSVQTGTTGYTVGGTNTINLSSAVGVVVENGVSNGTGGSVQEVFGSGITINQSVASAITNSGEVYLNIDGPISLSGSTLNVLASGANDAFPSGQVQFNGVISGAGSLNLGGTVTLAGANTYAGTTTIGSPAGGDVFVTNNNSLGAPSNTLTTLANTGSGLNIYGVSITQANFNLGADTVVYAYAGSGAGGADDTWNGPITLNNGTFASIQTVGTGVRLVVNGAVSGNAGGFEVGGAEGSGMVEFQQASTFTGAITVGASYPETLQLDSPNGLGAGGAGNGTTVTAGSSLLLNFPSGGALQDGGGNAEQLNLSGAGVSNAGALQTSGNGTVVLPGAVTLNGVTDFSVSSGTLLDNGALLNGASSGDLIKIGAGTMVLANTSATASNYSGGTEIAAGILLDETATANTGLGTGNVQVDNGATLQLGYASGTVGISIANNITFEGVSFAAGADASLEQLPSTATLEDTITGNLQLLAAATSQVPIAVDTAALGAFDLLDLAGDIITPGGAGTGGGFVVNAPSGANPTGALLLSGAGSYGGTTTVDNGQLDLQGTAGVVEVSGSALVINSPAFVNVQRNNLIAAASAVVINPESYLYLDGTNQTFGALTITGGEVENLGAGVLTLNGDVTAAGFIDANGNFDQAVITGGVLALNAAAGGNRNFTVNQPSPPPSGYEVDLAISSVVENDSAGSAASSLTLLGNGVVSLTAANTYTGATTVKGGALEVDGSQPQSTVTVAPAAGASAALAGAGTVAAVTYNTGTAGNGSATLGPGEGPTTGVLNTGNVTLDAGSIFKVQLNGTTAGSGYSQLVSSGAVNLGGATLSLVLGAVFPGDTSFTLVQAAQVVGTFGNAANGATFTTPDGWQFKIVYTATSVTATTVLAATMSTLVTVSSFDQPITLTATFQFPKGTINATGNIVFFDAQAILATVPFIFDSVTEQGTATTILTTLSVGQYMIAAAAAPSSGSSPTPAPTPRPTPVQPTVTTVILGADGSLLLDEPSFTTPQVLSQAGHIKAVSTVLDSSNFAAIYTITTGAAGPQYLNTLWENYNGVWTERSSGSFLEISATKNAAGMAVLFGLLTDGSLWEETAASGLNVGWAMRSPAGTIQSISAVTDGSGNEWCYAIVPTSDNLWVYSSALPTGWRQLSSGSFQQVSAGLNSAGKAVAYTVVAGGQLWEQNPVFGAVGLNTGFALLSGLNGLPATFQSVQAGSPDRAFAISSADETLWALSPGSGGRLSPIFTTTQVSATLTGTGTVEVFATLTDASLWEYLADSTGASWDPILTGDASSTATP